MPILFFGPNDRALDCLMVPALSEDRISNRAQVVADECGCRVDAYRGECDADPDQAEYLGISRQPGEA